MVVFVHINDLNKLIESNGVVTLIETKKNVYQNKSKKGKTNLDLERNFYVILMQKLHPAYTYVRSSIKNICFDVVKKSTTTIILSIIPHQNSKIQVT